MSEALDQMNDMEAAAKVSRARHGYTWLRVVTCGYTRDYTWLHVVTRGLPGNGDRASVTRAELSLNRCAFGFERPIHLFTQVLGGVSTRHPCF